MEKITQTDIEEAADNAVKKVFAILGVDVNVPKDVEEFRQDLRFSNSMRRAANRGFLAFVGFCAVGIGAAIAAGISSRFGGH